MRELSIFRSHALIYQGMGFLHIWQQVILVKAACFGFLIRDVVQAWTTPGWTLWAQSTKLWWATQWSIINHTSRSLLSLIDLHQILFLFADKTAENANTTMCIICKIYLIFFNISFAQYLSIFQLNLKLDRPVLLGHSQGGWLAQIYAAVFPDKVMYIVYRTKTSLL